MKALRFSLILTLALNLPISAQGIPPGTPPMTTPAGAILLPNLTFTNLTLTGVLKLADGTAAAPSLTFASATNTGLYLGSGNLQISAGGSNLFQFTSGARFSVLSDTGQIRLGANQDVILNWDAANTPALRNGTNPQLFNLYRTFTDASNYERLVVGADFSAAGSFDIITRAAGSGVIRRLTLGTSTAAWQVDPSGNLADLGSHTITAGSTVAAGNGNATINGSQNKLIQITGSTTTIGVEFNVGTPTLGTCTGGSMVSGSKNSLFEVTGNTSGSCVVNFGTPIWQNAPLCFVNDETALIAARISARTTNSITITGLGSGDAAQVYCLGRVGT